jgi:hypothetical protein
LTSTGQELVSDRKRPFRLPSLTWFPETMFRRVVALEAALPLLVVALVSTLWASLAPSSSSDPSPVALRWPGLLYFVFVAGGVARITGPGVAWSD